MRHVFPKKHLKTRSSDAAVAPERDEAAEAVVKNNTVRDEN